MRRIRSYTVIEMLVVMLISSLGIGIAYTCYTIFSHQYLAYKKGSDELADYILLDRLITTDISKCKRMNKTTEGIECVFSESTVRYEFYEEYVLRRNSATDTFYVQTMGSVIGKRMNKEENIPGTMLDALHFEAAYKKEKMMFLYQKNYGADILMSMEELDKPL